MKATLRSHSPASEAGQDRRVGSSRHAARCRCCQRGRAGGARRARQAAATGSRWSCGQGGTGTWARWGLRHYAHGARRTGARLSWRAGLWGAAAVRTVASPRLAGGVLVLAIGVVPVHLQAGAGRGCRFAGGERVLGSRGTTLDGKAFPPCRRCEWGRRSTARRARPAVKVDAAAGRTAGRGKAALLLPCSGQPNCQTEPSCAILSCPRQHINNSHYAQGSCIHVTLPLLSEIVMSLLARVLCPPAGAADLRDLLDGHGLLAAHSIVAYMHPLGSRPGRGWVG